MPACDFNTKQPQFLRSQGSTRLEQTALGSAPVARPTHRFVSQDLNARLVGDDLEEAFARFAGELLSHEFPGLHVYPTSGKDGAIDFSAPLPSGLLVGDFKCLSADGYEAAARAWREVERRLSVHLAGSFGPTIGQSQYAPWYSTEKPILKYCFCTSARLKNQAQEDRLEIEIRQFFQHFSQAYPHMAHLRYIDVAIIDWSDLDALLVSRPEVALRWFPALRPRSITIVDEAAAGTGTFREYLSARKLPYYSRRHHRELLHATSNRLDEDELLALIDFGATTGLLITGSGGIGKTRLSLELGHRAASMGWLVLRTVGRVERDDLEQFAEQLSRDRPVLLLIEYVETQRDFEALVGTLNEIGDQYGLRIGWIATCRTSYYGIVEAIPRHRRLDLSASTSSEDPASEAGFQAAVVRYILEKSGVGAEEDALRVCRNLPVLAVFLAYLLERGRQPDLAELLGEQDFGSWVARRVQSSFAGQPINRRLASLAAMLPLGTAKPAALPREEREIFDRLAADGWVERDASNEHSGGEAWFAAHDVLADQIVVSFLRTIPRTTDIFVRELFARAALLGTLDSVLFTMQRIHGDTPELPWQKLFSDSMQESATAWRSVRSVLLVSSLITDTEKIGLLDQHPQVWVGAEDNLDFQNRIGWLARHVTVNSAAVDRAARDILRDWIARIAPRVLGSNFALTCGLRFAPDLVRESARRWIHTLPRLFQTHYLLVAWLETGLTPSDIESPCEDWLRRWGISFHATFVYRAWLNAKGKIGVVRPFIAGWLPLHGQLTDAQFVYQAWLNARGEVDLVRPFIAKWLPLHGLSAEAEFVYKAWLDAKGDVQMIKPYVTEWLAIHHSEPQASYVYEAWLDAHGDIETVRDFITRWIAAHGLRADAQFVYRAWLEATGDIEVVRCFIVGWLQVHHSLPEAQYVYRSWLAAKGEIDVVRSYLPSWLSVHGHAADADFLFRAWLNAGGEFAEVASSVFAWVHAHREEHVAVYLLKEVARQTHLPDESVRDVLVWCRLHAFDDDALWRLSYLGNRIARPGLESDALEAVGTVVRAEISTRAANSSSRRANLLTATIANVARVEARGDLHERLVQLIRYWLLAPGWLGVSTPFSRHYDIRALIGLIAEACKRIDETEVRHDVVRRFLAWYATWDGDIREGAATDVEYISLLGRETRSGY